MGLCHKGVGTARTRRSGAGTGRQRCYLSDMLKPCLLVTITLTAYFLVAASPSLAFDLFARHEVTAQFATPDGKPMANAEVQVFAPGNPNAPAVTGRTDSNGKFLFDADQDGFWSAQARTADQVARISIRVGEGETRSQSLVSPFLVIGVLAILLGIAIWYRLLRIRSRRPRQ